MQQLLRVQRSAVTWSTLPPRRMACLRRALDYPTSRAIDEIIQPMPA